MGKGRVKVKDRNITIIMRIATPYFLIVAFLKNVITWNIEYPTIIRRGVKICVRYLISLCPTKVKYENERNNQKNSISKSLDSFLFIIIKMKAKIIKIIKIDKIIGLIFVK